MKYNPSKIEKKWQKYWETEKVYRANDSSKKEKYYQLETFPYPSAAGLHVGHPKGYIAEDIHARYTRMKGKEVLYTMGWDAFGLPTENYAIKIGKSPQEVAKTNIKNFKKQIQMFGLSYDWDREINTSSPEYYKWTQWIFIQLYKAGLAYQKLAKVNWCPQDQTVLANEQVVDGKCERCDSQTEQKEIKQWFFKITDYADKLLADLNELDWPQATVKRQKDWIGRSEGTSIKFKIQNSKLKIEIFTTRPDTLFGATYIVLAPEHSRISDLKFKISNWEEVEKYIKKASLKTELQRKEEAGEKTGIELKGIKAINPASQEKVSIWVADYVLDGYGTGAIMAVPAHDQRDYEFAKKFNLPIRKVIMPEALAVIPRNLEDVAAGAKGDLRIESDCWEGDGELINSGKFNGVDSKKAKSEITKFIGGEKQTQYRIRDWSVSRQRYWGVPIPVIYCDKCGTVPVSEEDLPVKLPVLKDYRPKGVAPLASSKKFLETECPNCKSPAKRDPETLDTFVDSSWYFLRYTDPDNKKVFASKEKLKTWLPVNLYVIGAEHATLHLLYARFIFKFLSDQGYFDFKEPFLKLRHVGLIQGNDGQKMSKSRGNTVNPDEVVGEHGADAVRMYEMFMGPFEDGQPWSTDGVVGIYRFLNRIWYLVSSISYEENKKENKDLDVVVNKAIKKIGEDIEGFRFNTCVSELMKLLNSFEDANQKGYKIQNTKYEVLLLLLAPFAPHITEELWMEILKSKTSIHLESWPEYDGKLLAEEKVNFIVQVNGRVRDTLKVNRGLFEDEVKKLALESDNVKRHISGDVKKVIYVKDKVLNFVL